MEPQNWEELAGTVVDGRFRLRTLTCAQRDQAEWIAQDENEPDGGPVALTLIAPSPEEAGQLRSKLLDAASLQDANLLRLAGAGDAGIPEAPLLYLASESADETLADRLRRGTLPDADARRLIAGVTGGLRYLHGRGLACRALEPQGIVRIGGTWKLADYARIHPIGVPDPGAAAELHGSRYIAPEAYDGSVLAASDVWSLAVLITEALAGTTAPVMLPEPFDTVCRACFEMEPERRPGLAEVAAKLAPAETRDESICGAGSQPAAASQAASGARTERPPQPRALPRNGDTGRLAIAIPPQLMQIARSRTFLIGGIALIALVVLWTRRSPVPESEVLEKSVPKVVQSAPEPARPAAKRQPAATHKPGVTGRADFAGSEMQGRRTASGERFNNNALTAAHPKYRLGTRVRVTNLANDRSVVVRINDRGSLRRGYVIRLTRGAARQLGFGRSGSARVRLEVVETD